MSELKWDLREAQKKLKKLGVAPPPPKGKPVLADIMKPGKFYAHPPSLEKLQAYEALLLALLEAQGRKWTPAAFLHNVLAAALKSAPEKERLARPHGHVPARPVIDNHGYLALAMLAAEHVSPHVTKEERPQFEAWLALGHTVAEGKELTDDALLDSEMPLTWQPSGASARNFTATSPALLVAQGVALEAEEAAIHNVGGKGAREACARAVTVLNKPGEARRFLEALDRLIQLHDAKLQLSKVSEKPSAPVVAGLWRGAEKGKSTHWLVKLDNGRYALLWKVKGKWRLVEGSKEDALASVPDAHLKEAVNALAARSD